MTNVLIIALASFFASSVSLYFLIPYLTKKAFLDIPNERSSHTKVTPRGGGIGVVFGILVGSIVAYFLGLPVPHLTFFIGIGLIAFTSFMDDRKSLPVYIRLSAHLTAMILVIYQTGGMKSLPFPEPLNIELGWFGYIFTGIWIVSVINFFNFLDGIDGFSGSQATIAGLALAFICWLDASATIAICIAFASLGFLLFNWHPAKIFMGDVGSVSLGFIFATLPFYSTKANAEVVVYSTAIFLWFFLADGAFTLIRRALNKERVWEAHRSHLYQRLNKSGWKHDKIVLLVMSLSCTVIGIQVYFFKIGYLHTWWSLLAGIVLFVLYTWFVFLKENQIKKTN
jgi:Fuc2NAc and GlcNAc transferase